ncbi:HAD family hydrolase, partial [Klebsiella pneumoniae]|uniref:HAD family hydrolase n=2 Tax=Pseudomonadota TaxID=1224 RepID=UPI0013D1B2C7
AGFVSVGSPRYAAEQAVLDDETLKRITSLEAEGKTVVAVLESKRMLGLIALRDEPRDDAREGLARLQALGVQAVMLTGD